jgi:hypothetical protein
MTRDAGPQLEAAARRQLTRLIDGFEVTPYDAVGLTFPQGGDGSRGGVSEPLRLVVPISPTGGSPTGDGPSGPRRPRRARHLAGHRRTLALAAAGLVAAVALLALVALPDSDQEGDLSTDSGPGTTAITEPAPSTEATTGTTGTTGTTPGTDRATPAPPDGECA